MKSALPGSWHRYGPNTLAGKALTLWRAGADLIWPPQCPITGKPVAGRGQIDAEAWAQLTFLAAPQCDLCGAPFDYPIGAGALCGACAARTPAYARARAAFVYDEHSRGLVLALKHAGRTDVLAAYGLWMRRAGAGLLEGADRLIPIPLHPRRLRQRRFNQSLLLAQAVSQATAVPVAPHVLERARATPSQGGLSGKARQRNVAGAFKVRPDARVGIAGRRLVLIDDVHTTGATLEACARVLKRAGAEDVTALTLARVVKPVDPIK